MRALILIIAVLATAGPPRSFPLRTPPEATADSLYDAQAIDTLYAFSSRIIERAQARGDSALFGRMTYHRGRARLALRDPGAEGDFDLALAVATILGDSIGSMHALGLKAFVAVNQGRFEESIELNRRRVALARALRRRGSEGWGHLLIGYAELYRENYDAAKSEYEEAWRAFEEPKRPRDQLSASIGLARALDKLGRYDEARTSCQRAWLTAREIGDRGQEADAINNLGVWEQEHGDLSAAAEYYDRAYELKRGVKAFDIASIARNVATVDMMIGRFAHAESTLVEAQSLENRGMLDTGLAVDLGRLRLVRGRFAGAAQSFRGVLAQRKSLPEKTRIEAITYLAEAMAARDSVEAAVAMLDREFKMLRTDSPSHYGTDALLVWSRCLREADQALRARDAALAAWTDAGARRDSTHLVVAAAEVSMAERALRRDTDAFAWFQRANDIHRGDRSEGEYQWREARRAILSRALIQSGDVLRVHPATATDEQRFRSLFDFLEPLRSRTLLERATDPRRFDDIDPALMAPVTSEVLQQQVLRANECFFSVSSGPGCLYVFAVTPETFRAHVIDDADGAITTRFQNLVRLSSRAPDAGGGSTDAALRALGKVLFNDLAPVIRGSQRVLVSLDGPVSGTPFEALVCPGESDPLLVAHEVVRVPSAAFVRYLRARPDRAPSSSSLLAVAAGAPALRGARDEVNHLARRYARTTRAIDPDRADFLASLTRYDVIHVASHVHLENERPWNSGIMLGTSVAPVNRADGAAAHGPLGLSTLDSTEIARALPADPFVRASDIANRRLDARLVVLSACESALGRATVAEGVLGITSSFVSAGSRTVVASLWEVDDRTTADLMKRFYRELSAGKSTAAALRAAQLEVRRRHPLPFYWAGFVVIGDGDVTVPLQKRHNGVLLMALTGLTLMIAAPWVVWRRRRRAGRIAA